MGHTPRNLTLFAHQPPTAAASGAEAVPLGSGDASPHPPALPCAGRGQGVTNPLRRGTAAAGRGLLPSYRRLLLGRPLPYRQSDALGIQGVSTASRIHRPRTGGGAGGGRKARKRTCRRPGGNPAADRRRRSRRPGGSPAADRRRRTHAQKGARGRGTRGTGRREGCGVWGGLSGPGPAVRAAREAAGGARPPGGYPGVSSSGPRPLHA